MEQHYDPPERRGEARPDAAEPHQAALLIDFDNVTMGIRSNLGQELRSLLNSDIIRGKVAVQRAYADWRRYPQYIVPLSEASIDLIFAPAYGSSKKNATDIRLAIDALELVFVRPEIRTFILMSGDSDFSSLVLKLKEYGRYVIGVGIQESSSDLLVQNCDEYYSYSALSGLTRAGDEPAESHDPWVLVETAIGRMVERGDTMRSDRLKQVMLEIDPSFNEKELGFTKFNRFMVEAKSRGLLSIQKMENGQYGVAPGGKAVKTGEREKPERKEARPAARRAGERRGRERKREKRDEEPRTEGQTTRARPKLSMKTALELLHRALDTALEGEAELVRDSDVKRKMLELDAAFDEGELGFSKFSKFLLAAEEEGAIALTRGPNGNFHVGRRTAGRGRRRRTRDERAPAVSEEKPKETKMKRLARLLFGEPPAAPEAGAETVSEAPASARAAPRPERPERRERRDEPGRRRAEAAAPRASRGGRRRREPVSRAGDRPAPSTKGEPRGPRERKGRGAESRSRPPRGRTERRRRPEARPAEAEPVVEARPEAPAAEAEPLVEARPEPAVSEAPAEGRAAPEVEETPAVTPAPLPRAPRGTIRGRWGTRGRYRPSEARPPILEGQRIGGAERGAAARRTEPGDGTTALVEQLKRYEGVGEKTAETLVEAFGADLLHVLDEEPDRVREVLPDRRADRVLEARRKERDAGGA